MKSKIWLLLLGIVIWALLMAVKIVVSLQSETAFDISDVWLMVPVTMIVVWAALCGKEKGESKWKRK
jgi:hypothetical protein